MLHTEIDKRKLASEIWINCIRRQFQQNCSFAEKKNFRTSKEFLQMTCSLSKNWRILVQKMISTERGIRPKTYAFGKRRPNNVRERKWKKSAIFLDPTTLQWFFTLNSKMLARSKISFYLNEASGISSLDLNSLSCLIKTSRVTVR